MSDQTAAEEIARIVREADGSDAAGMNNGDNGAGSDAVRRADDLGMEAPEADTAEQRAELLQRRDDPVADGPADRDGEANPADTAEQRRVAGVDDEDEEERRR
jgi:hypothetical protein